MVKASKKNNAKSLENQGNSHTLKDPVKIGPDTLYETCGSSMTAFGGLLSLVKFLDLVKFKEIFELATEGVFSQKQIASLYGISKGNVSKIKTGKVASRITGKIYKPVGRGKGRVK